MSADDDLGSTRTRAMDLDSDEEKAQRKADDNDLRKIEDMTDFRIVAIARSALLEQALWFILNARKPPMTSTGPVKSDAAITATMTYAQWEQIEELLNP